MSQTFTPIREHEVKIDLNWTADRPTQEALERQAVLMGFNSPKAYLEQAIAAVLSGKRIGQVGGKAGAPLT